MDLRCARAKTKEIVLDFHRAPPSLQPIIISGTEVEVVLTYKYLGLHLNNKARRLTWRQYTERGSAGCSSLEGWPLSGSSKAAVHI